MIKSPKSKKIDAHTLRVLEYPKILQKLANETISVKGYELAVALTPFTDYNSVKQTQLETEEMYFLLGSNTSVLRGNIEDIRPMLKAASIGQILNPLDLRSCANTLRALTYTHKTIKRAIEKTPVLNSICERIENFSELISEIDQKVTPRGEVDDSASPKLFSIRTDIFSEERILQKKAHTILKNALTNGYAQENLITERNNRVVIPIKNDFRSQVKGIIHDISASGATVFLEPLGLIENGNLLRELKLSEKREVTRILKSISSSLDSYQSGIATGIEVLGLLDLIQAKAKLAKQLDCAIPSENQTWLNESGKTTIKNGKHPLLKGAVIPLNLDIGKAHPCLLITGPNSGGKTVALKTVGLLALMVQSGLLVPCEKGSRFNVYEYISADIGDEQSIEQSLSTFSSHMTNIKKILELSNPRSLVLLDELGAGTDPLEGAALAKAILEVLLAKKATIIATTHHGELKTLALENKQIRNAAVQFNMETLQPTFHLEIGLPGESNALAIASKIGLDEEVLRKAALEISPDRKTLDSAFLKIRKELEDVKKIKNATKAVLTDLETEKSSLQNERNNNKKQQLQALKVAEETASEIVAKAKRILKKTEDNRNRFNVEETTRIQNDLQDISATLKHIEKETTAYRTPSVQREIELGDLIHVRDINQIGEALGVIGDDGRVEVAFGSMHIKVSIDHIEKIEHIPKESRQLSRDVKQPSALPLEIDLRGQRVEEACLHSVKIIDDAFESGLSSIRIIHGKGTGALRMAIHETLSTHPLVTRYHSPPAQDGGEGVTIITLVDN